MKGVKLLNWNAEFAGPRSKRTPLIRETIFTHRPDVVCLTEAYPQTLPDDGEMITSAHSGGSTHEDRGARKAVLWSRAGWSAVDVEGSERLPEGRYVSGVTQVHGVSLRVVALCIPYHAYRTTERWGVWDGARAYLDALREDVLPRFTARTVLLGDFNLQIPARGYPGKGSDVDQKRERTFAAWQIPTAGQIPGLDKPFIDHVALTPDLSVPSVTYIHRVHASGIVMSDHNGAVVTVKCHSSGT